MSAEGKKKDKGFITLLVLIIVCACLMIAAVTTLGIGMSNGDIGGSDQPGQSGEVSTSTKWSSGNGAPASDMGIEGDFYLDTSTGKLYKKTAGGWQLEITIPLASEVTPFINEDGFWQIGDEVTQYKAGSTEALIPSIGEDGFWYFGKSKTEYRAWHEFEIKDGYWYIDGVKSAEAVIMPHIGNSDNGEEEGYWYIGETFTGVKAVADVKVENGQIYVDGVAVPSVKGADGFTPFINEKGNWQIGAMDTGIPARGQDGVDGNSPYIDEATGNWFIGGQDTGVAATGAAGKSGTYWHSGKGTPISDVADEGANTYLVVGADEGDFYFDIAEGDIYRYADGAWEFVTSVAFKLTGNEWTINGKHTGLIVAQWYNGEGDPNGVNGSKKIRGYKGDYYLDTVTGNIYINVSEEADLNSENMGSKWELLLTIRSTQWFSDECDPAESKVFDGKKLVVGDLFLNKVSGQIFEYRYNAATQANEWVVIEGLNLKGGLGDRASHMFVGKGNPNSPSAELKEKLDNALAGDYYLDTQSGIIYYAVADTSGNLVWNVANGTDALKNWISGTGEPGDDLPAQAGLLYFDTSANTMWRYNGDTEKWEFLGRLAGATKWYHGYYDVDKISKYTQDDIDALEGTEAEEYAAFIALTKDAIEGDFYLQTFYEFSGYKGMKMFVYQNGRWALLVDLSQPFTPDPGQGYNVPTLDALTEFRNRVNDGSFTGEDHPVTLNGIITMPDGDFTPVGSDANPFTGTFDGQAKDGYYIEGLNGPLFGTLGNNATVKDLDLKGDLNEKALAALATFFAEGSKPAYGSLLTDLYGLAQKVEGTVEIENVTLKLESEEGSVTVHWGTGIDDVTVNVTGNKEGENYLLTIDGDADDYIGLLALGKADFTFTDVAFEGNVYLDVTDAKSLTLDGVYADVDPIEAAKRKADGSVNWVSEDLSGLYAENRSEFAAFIVSTKEVEGNGLDLTITDSTIISAQSTNDTDCALTPALKIPDINSMAVYISTKLNKVTITGNTFGSEKDTERYAYAAVKLDNIATDATIEIENNTVYGTNNHGKDGRGEPMYDFSAFALKGAADAVYTATLANNTVDVSVKVGGKDYYVLSVEGTAKAQVYLMGETNTMNAETAIFKYVKAADDAIDFVIFNAALNATNKITDGYAYLGTQYGAAHTFTQGRLQSMVEADEGKIWVIDLGYAAEGDPLAFVQYLSDYSGTENNKYHINNVMGLRYFSDTVNGTGIYDEAMTYEGKTVSLAKGEGITYDIATLPAPAANEAKPAWTPIGVYDEAGANSKPFMGTFDGNLLTIENLTAALFGNLGAGATVQQVNINGAAISADKYVGAVAAVATGNVTINNVHITNTALTLTMPTTAKGEFDTTKGDLKYARSIGAFVGAAESGATVTLQGVYFGQYGEGNTDASTFANEYTEGKLNLLVYNYGLVGSKIGDTSAADTWAAGKSIPAAADVNIQVGEDEYGEDTITASFNAEIASSALTLTASWMIETPYYVGVTAYDAIGLANIAELVNGGITFEGQNIMVGADIDASVLVDANGVSTWKGIGVAGDETKAFKGTFGAPNDITGAPLPIHAINNLTGALFGNLQGTVQNLAINAQALQSKNSIAESATGATIDNVTIDAWVQTVNGASAAKVSDFASAPFGIVDAIADNKITDVNITVDFKAQGIVFNAEIDENANVEATFTGDTIEGTPTEATEYKAVVENEHFILGQFAGKKAYFTFTGIQFKGDTYINVDMVEGLTVKNCYANVTPANATATGSMYSKGCSRSAFIAGSSEDQEGILFVVENNLIISAKGATDSYGTAIFVWASLANGSRIANNTFGSDSSRYTFAVSKFFGATEDAILEYSNNTIYGNAAFYTEGLAYCPNQTHNKEVQWVIDGNTLDIKATDRTQYALVCLDSDQGNALTRAYITKTNTVKYNGEVVPFSVEETIKDSERAKFDYVGYDVDMDIVREEDTGAIKSFTVKSGNFIFGADDYVDTTYHAGNADTFAQQVAKLNKVAAADVKANIHILIGEGIGRRLSDLTKTTPDYNTYYIFSEVGFKSFMALVESGFDFTGKTVKPDYSETHTIELAKFVGEDNVWAPIGTADKPFKGSFNGSYGEEGAGAWTIDATGVTFPAEGPIGFFGVIEGGSVENFTFKNFTVSATNASTALVGVVAGQMTATEAGAKVANIAIENVTVGTQAQAVGAAVGSAANITFENIDVKGVTINMNTNTAGAVVGIADSCTMKDIRVGGGMQTTDGQDAFVPFTAEAEKVSIQAKSLVGGVVGEAKNGITISGGVYSAADIKAKMAETTDGMQIGGIIAALTATDAANAFTVDGAHFVGTMARTWAVEGTTSSLYENYGLIGAYTTETKGVLTIKNSNLTVVLLAGEEGEQYVQDTQWDNSGAVSSTYYIYGLEGFKYFRDQVNGGTTYEGETVHLMNDIDLNNEDWTPIGNSETVGPNETPEYVFKGTFTAKRATAAAAADIYVDGEDSGYDFNTMAYTISNLKILGHEAHTEAGTDTANGNNMGLFGRTYRATIEYVNIDGATITGNASLGALIGTGKETSINYVTVANVTITGHHFAGGLVGHNDCSAGVNDIGVETYTGDVVVGLTVRLTPNLVGGASINLDNGDKLGGLVGWSKGSKFTNNVVSQASLTGYRDIGGLAGIDYGTIEGYTGNTVEDTVITVKRDKFSAADNTVDGVVDEFCNFAGDYQYATDDPQMAEWMVGRCRDTNPTAGGANVEGGTFGNIRKNVTINYYAQEGSNGLIYDNGGWRIIGAQGLKTFATLSAGKAGKHDGHAYTEGFADQTIILDQSIAVEADADYLPIENFAGIFNGHGNTISGINANLFKDLKGDVTDLTIAGASIEVTDGNAGILAGTVSAAVNIKNIKIEGAIAVTAGGTNAAGALIGELTAAANIENIEIAATGSVVGNIAGGVIGKVTVAPATFKTISVKGITVGSATAAAAAGGVIGQLGATFAGFEAISVEADVIANAETGIAGAFATYTETANGSAVKGFTFYGTLTGKTTVMLTGANANAPTFTGSKVALTDVVEHSEETEGFWFGANADAEGTILEETGYYFIESSNGLTAFAAYVNGGETIAKNTVYLLNNIEMGAWQALEGTFAGTFDGQGHTIEIAYPEYGTFFGAVAGTADETAAVKNVTFDGIAVAASMENAAIDTVTVTLAASGAGKGYFGLVAGAEAETVTIKNSSIAIDCDEYQAKFAWDAEGAVTLQNVDDTNAYIIKTEGGLTYLADLVETFDFEGMTVELAADIALQNDWAKPIGSAEKPFKGTFNGGTYTISNLKIRDTVSAEEYIGLFGYVIGGEIKDLEIGAASIIVAKNYVGALAGYVEGTTISNITVTETAAAKSISSTGDYVGALVGFAKGATVTGVTITGASVKSANKVGGLFGAIEGEVTVTETELTGMAISSSTANCGALVGNVAGTMTATFTFEGTVSGADPVAPNYGTVGTVESGTFTINEGSVVTLTLTDGYVLTVTWQEGGPVETVSITTQNGLDFFRNQINGGDNYEGVVVTIAAGEYEFTEVLAADKHFKGTFMGEEDKAAETILNGTIGGTVQGTVGFFSMLEAGTVKNLTFNVTIDAPKANGVGAVAAWSVGATTIENVTVNATKVIGGKWVGGIVGYAITGITVKNCTVTGDFSVQDCYLGAIAGFLGEGGNTVEGNTIGTEEAPVTLTALASDGTLDEQEDPVNGYGCIAAVMGHGAGNTVNDNTIYATIDVSAAISEYQTYVGVFMADGQISATGNSGYVTIVVEEEVAHATVPATDGLYGVGGTNSNAEAENDITVNWSGIEINGSAYSVDNVQEFILFTDLVNNGNDFGGKTVKLAGDIDFEYKEYTPVGGTMITKEGDAAPVCTNPFKGTFDGNGKTISNYFADGRGQGTFGGIFGYIVGEQGKVSVTNLNIVNIKIVGYAIVGAVTGAIENGIIENVTVKGDIQLVSDHVDEKYGTSAGGGIAGVLYAASTVNCTVEHAEGAAAAYAAVRLAADGEAADNESVVGTEPVNQTHIIAALQYVGGIAARLDFSMLEEGEKATMIFEELSVNGMVIQILADEDGQVPEGTKTAGGIVGTNNATAADVDSFEVHDNDVRKTEFVYPQTAEGEETDVKVGGIIGENTTEGFTPDVMDSNALQDVTKGEVGSETKETLKDGLVIEPVVEGKSLMGAFEYKNGEKVGEAHWYEVPDEQAFADLSAELAKNPSADVYLTKVAANGSAVYDMTDMTRSVIGSTLDLGIPNSDAFSGHFYGNGATIVGLSNPIFGSVNDGAVIENLTLGEEGTDFTVKGYGVAWIAAAPCAGTLEIINCVNNVNVESSSKRACAFMVGTKGTCVLTMVDCVNNGDLYSPADKPMQGTNGNHAAAFVGYAQGSSLTIKNCINNGNIDVASIGDGRHNIGGFISTVQGGSASTNLLINCENHGNITSNMLCNNGGNSHAGGLIGRNNNGIIIENCVNTGNITAKGGELAHEKAINSYAGGFIGCNGAKIQGTNNVVEGVITAELTGSGAFGAGALFGTGGNTSEVENVKINVTVDPIQAVNYGMVGSNGAIGTNFKNVEYTLKLADGFTHQGAWDAEGVYTDKDYVVTSAAGLKAFSDSVNAGNAYEGATVKLGAEIDLTDIQWSAIGAKDTTPFKGTFDGQGNTIENLSVESVTGDTSIGLFGYANGATIQGLTLNNAQIKQMAVSTSTVYIKVGSLVGTATNSTISDITLTGLVEQRGAGYGIGGICGYAVSTNFSDITIDVNADSLMMFSWNRSQGDIRTAASGVCRIGGISGWSYGSNYTSINSNLNVIGATVVGGIVGLSQGSESYTDIIVSGSVYATNASGSQGDTVDGVKIGAIVGSELGTANDTFAFDNVHFSADLVTYGGWNEDYTAHIPDEVPEIYEAYYGFLGAFRDGVNISIINSSIELGVTDFGKSVEWDATGKVTECYVVYTAEGLAAFRDSVNIDKKNYAKETVCLASDIDLANMAWKGIGDATTSFNGTFDGKNYTIKNLSVTATSNYAGLFGKTANGAIRNLTIDGATITGVGSISFVGVVVGYQYTSTISNIQVKNAVITGRFVRVGGISGHGYGSISDCYAQVIFTGGSANEYVQAGGIRGANCSGTIQNCYVDINMKRGAAAGGIVGFFNGAEGAQKIINCYVKGYVEGYKRSDLTDYTAGGIVGEWYSNANHAVTNCYFDGTCGEYASDIIACAFNRGSTLFDPAQVMATAWSGRYSYSKYMFEDEEVYQTLKKSNACIYTAGMSYEEFLQVNAD